MHHLRLLRDKTVENNEKEEVPRFAVYKDRETLPK